MGPKTTKKVLRKNIVGGIILSNSNSYIAMITMSVGCQKDRPIDQWNQVDHIHTQINRYKSNRYKNCIP